MKQYCDWCEQHKETSRKRPYIEENIMICDDCEPEYQLQVDLELVKDALSQLTALHGCNYELTVTKGDETVLHSIVAGRVTTFNETKP